MNGVSTTLDNLLRLALTGQHYNQQRLGDQAYRYARRITNHRCRDLPEDLHEEIFHEAFAELFAAGPLAIQTQSPKQAFRRAIYAAIRIVRASYAPPGQRTRHNSTEARVAKVAAEDIGRVIGPREIEQILVKDGPSVRLDFGRVSSLAAENEVKLVEDRLAIEAILDSATPETALALRLIHIDGEPVGAVATLLGISRFSLTRRIAAFAATWRAAA